MVYAIGPVSGAHLNPAVTLAGIIAGKFQPAAFLYMLTQCIAGIAAAITYGLMFGTSFTLAPVGRFHWGTA